MSDITRRDFIKTAAGGAAGLAFLGAAVVGGSTYATYLPTGGSRMNVVAVNLGNLRRDHVGVYGNDWIKTPNLDALADSSLRFTRPYPESIPTICARRAIYTGTRTWPFRGWEPPGPGGGYPAGWRWMAEDQTSMTETLTGNGYSAALVTDNYHQFEPSMNFHRGFSAFDFVRGQELDPYRSSAMVTDEEVDRYTVPGNDETAREKVRQHLANTADRTEETDHSAPRVFRRGIEYLRAASRSGGAFFLVVDSFDPHEPWDPPERYANLYGDPIGKREPTVPNYGNSDYLEEAELRRMRELYAGSVTMTDRWFGELVNELENLNLLDQTLLLAFSEHGVALGEHDYTGKVPEALWPELTGNVMYLRHPEGRGADRTSDYRASLQDLAPTILGVSGETQETGGQDLGVLLDGGEPEQTRSHATLGFDDYSWTEDDDYALAVRNDGAEARLYDVRQDPKMENDISAENREVVRRMYEEYIVADAGGEPPPVYREA